MNDARIPRKTIAFAVAATGTVAGVVAGLVAALVLAVSPPAFLHGQGTQDSAEAAPEATEGDTDSEVAVDLLPYEPEEIIEDGELAVEFAELYTRVEEGEDSEAHHEALSELASDDFAELLEPRPSSVDIRDEMLTDGVTVSTSAELSGIRDIFTDQITVVVDCTLIKHENEEDERNDHEFAVSLISVEDGWEVDDLQLAEHGQSGDESGSREV